MSSESFFCFATNSCRIGYWSKFYVTNKSEDFFQCIFPLSAPNLFGKFVFRLPSSSSVVVVAIAFRKSSVVVVVVSVCVLAL